MLLAIIRLQACPAPLMAVKLLQMASVTTLQACLRHFTKLKSEAMTQVYKGRWNGMLVAVKVLHTSMGEAIGDFQRECAILERLRHSHVIMYLGMASNAEGQVRPASLCERKACRPAP